MKIVKRKIEDLTFYESNAKLHPKEQIDKIVSSIETFGFTTPVLIDKDDMIIAGHGRVMAAREMGMSEVPAIRLEHLTPEQVKAYRIADNRLSQTGWNIELLRVEIEELRGIDFDIPLLGFENIELMDILPDVVVLPKKINETYEESYSILIQCADEIEQKSLLTRFLKEKLKCRALIS